MKYKPVRAHVSKDGKSVTLWEHDHPQAPELGSQKDGSHVGLFPTHYNGKEIEPEDREGLWRGDADVLARYQP